jgi:hypothetical protein
MHKLQTLRELRQENQALQREVYDIRASLEEAQARADLAQRAAEDAWAFARVTLRMGQSEHATPGPTRPARR